MMPSTHYILYARVREASRTVVCPRVLYTLTFPWTE